MSGAQWPCTAFLQGSWLGWKLVLKKDSGLLGSHTSQGEYSQMKEDTPHRHTNKKQMENNSTLWKEQQREKKNPPHFFLNLPKYAHSPNSAQVPRVKVNKPTMGVQLHYQMKRNEAGGRSGKIGQFTPHLFFLHRKQRKGLKWKSSVPQAKAGDQQSGGLDPN